MTVTSFRERFAVSDCLETRKLYGFSVAGAGRVADVGNFGAVKCGEVTTLQGSGENKCADIGTFERIARWRVRKAQMGKHPPAT